jgi:hypothetical protein
MANTVDTLDKGSPMTHSNSLAAKLALEIASCDEVQVALNRLTHPCHGVVSWQAKQWIPSIATISESSMHRPEAWTGDIEKASIIFLSSNPSFNKDENYPNWLTSQWAPEKIIDFAFNRFSRDKLRMYGATEYGSLKNFDRTVELDGALSKSRVRYWSWVRKLVSHILDKPEDQVSAIDDYVMTEIVHCKSTYEEGVISARKKCKDKYLERILALSPAELVFVVGKNAALDMQSIFPDQIPKNWAEINGGFWPKTIQEFPEIVKRGLWGIDAQEKHSVQIEIGGKIRTVIYFAKPGGGGGLYSPWRNRDLIHPEILEKWRSAIKKEGD